MTSRSIALLEASVLLVAGVLPVGSAPLVAAQLTTITCPATVAVSASASQGWTTVSKAIAVLKKAEVDNSVGLSGPTLNCSYCIGTDATLEIARLARPEPAGLLCTVNPTKSTQFDCFPRPTANPTPAVSDSHH